MRCFAAFLQKQASRRMRVYLDNKRASMHAHCWPWLSHATQLHHGSAPLQHASLSAAAPSPLSIQQARTCHPLFCHEQASTAGTGLCR